MVPVSEALQSIEIAKGKVTAELTGKMTKVQQRVNFELSEIAEILPYLPESEYKEMLVRKLDSIKKAIQK